MEWSDKLKEIKEFRNKKDEIKNNNSILIEDDYDNYYTINEFRRKEDYFVEGPLKSEIRDALIKYNTENSKQKYTSYIILSIMFSFILFIIYLFGK